MVSESAWHLPRVFPGCSRLDLVPQKHAPQLHRNRAEPSCFLPPLVTAKVDSCAFQLVDDFLHNCANLHLRFCTAITRNSLRPSTTTRRGSRHRWLSYPVLLGQLQWQYPGYWLWSNPHTPPRLEITANDHSGSARFLSITCLHQYGSVQKSGQFIDTVAVLF